MTLSTLLLPPPGSPQLSDDPFRVDTLDTIKVEVILMELCEPRAALSTSIVTPGGKEPAIGLRSNGYVSLRENRYVVITEPFNTQLKIKGESVPLHVKVTGPWQNGPDGSDVRT